MQTEAKVGLAVIIGAAMLILLLGRVERWATNDQDGSRITARFDSVAGLEIKSPVQVAGVQVGEVEAIRLDGSMAEATILLYPGVTLYKGTQAAVRSTGLLGEKYLELLPGRPQDGSLGDGASITQLEGSGDLDVLINSLNAIASDLRSVSASLRGAIGTPEGQQQLADIVNNLHAFSDTLGDRGPRVLARLESIVEKIDSGAGTFGRLVNDPNIYNDLEETLMEVKSVMSRVREGEGTLGKLIQDEGLYGALENAANQMGRIAERVNAGEGTLGRLLVDDSPVDSFSSAMDSLGNMGGTINRLRTFITFHSEFQLDSEEGKGYFEVRLAPRETSSYIIQLVDDPQGRVQEFSSVVTVGGVPTITTELRTDHRMLISAMFERSRGPFSVHGGLMESTMGIGFKVKPFGGLSMGFDAWDFNSQRAGQDTAHLKVAARYNLGPYVFVEGGVDNIIESNFNTSFVGAGLTFEDKDLKYLLGAASGALN